MGVGKNDMVHFGGFEAQISVHRVGFEPLPLKHSAIEKDFFPALGGYQVFAAGNFAGSSNKFYFHGSGFNVDFQR